jgi:uncharacterized PurR-regulated membrane protein YhhQ (DUF165 family)
MKGVENKLACGTFVLIYLNLLLTIQLITGFEIIGNVTVLIILGIFGLPVIFFIGHKASESYDEENNNNKIYYVIIIILIGVCLFLSYLLSENAH